MPDNSFLVSVERIEKIILLVRGHKVILDKDLAGLYGVGTRDLNKAVSRNLKRFPGDFMFALSKQEVRDLMFHFGTSSWGGTRKTPRAFTEQGVAMLSSILKSDRAINVNIEIMRAFVRLRQILSSHADLAKRLDDLEKNYSTKFKAVFEAIRQLMIPPTKPRRKIGFKVQSEE